MIETLSLYTLAPSFVKKWGLFFGFIVSLSLVHGQEKIYWNPERPIEFSDFQGTPTIRGAAAMSYCGIKFNSCTNQRYPSYSVSAYFEPHNSWSWKNYRYSYVLRHERLHFDIAEIFARKMRKYFAENQVSSREAYGVYKRVYMEYEQFQEEYDKETRHGTNNTQQRLWQEKIESLLESLSEYATNECY